MRKEQLLVVLMVLNLAFFIISCIRQINPVLAEGTVPVLRVRALELVDGQGRVRASLGVLPAKVQANGEMSRETVLFRLITEQGRPSVKIGASEETSGLSFAGPTGTSDTYVILQASGRASSLKLRNEDGSEQILKP